MPVFHGLAGLSVPRETSLQTSGFDVTHGPMTARIPPITRVVLCVLVALAADSAHAACPTEPRPWCRQFGQTQLRLDAASGAFEWRGGNGPSSVLSDFGVPQASTGYSLCAWDGNNLLLASELPAASTCGGLPCWSTAGSGGLRYRNDAAAAGELSSLEWKASSKGKTRLKAKGAVAASVALPLQGRVTLQLLRDDSALCFEGSFPAAGASTNGATQVQAKWKHDPSAVVPSLPSGGCGGSPSPYAAGVSTAASLVHDGLTRSFRTWIPSAYDDASPLPVVLLLHGGFGSGAQIEGASRMLDVAAASGFVVVSPDGSTGPGGVRAWNAGLCCGAAAANEVDDVGFLAALLDRLEQELCIDRRRVFATGMSNGGLLAHRLACDLGDRIAAVAPVAGTDMTYGCDPLRPVPIHEVHGSADANVPFDGGPGCGPAGASYRSVPGTMTGWKQRNDCKDAVTSTRTVGDATCTRYGQCAPGTLVELCVVDGGGHQWPGGEPPVVAGLPGCSFGVQSQSYSASEEAWKFFRAVVPD